MIATASIVEHRSVLTYVAEGKPAGVITGYEDRDTFVVEHVITFPDVPRATLLRLLRFGLEEAWERYRCVIFCLPTDNYRLSRFRSIGRVMGFRPYALEGGLEWFVAWKP